jgi:hypothetical protein
MWAVDVTIKGVRLSCEWQLEVVHATHWCRNLTTVVKASRLYSDFGWAAVAKLMDHDSEDSETRTPPHPKRQTKWARTFALTQWYAPYVFSNLRLRRHIYAVHDAAPFAARPCIQLRVQDALNQVAGVAE